MTTLRVLCNPSDVPLTHSTCLLTQALSEVVTLVYRFHQCLAGAGPALFGGALRPPGRPTPCSTKGRRIGRQHSSKPCAPIRARAPAQFSAPRGCSLPFGARVSARRRCRYGPWADPLGRGLRTCKPR